MALWCHTETSLPWHHCLEPQCHTWIKNRERENMHFEFDWPRRTSNMRQVEDTNRELKHILEKMVNVLRKDWPNKLGMMHLKLLWIYLLLIGVWKVFHLFVQLDHKAYWIIRLLNFDMKASGNDKSSIKWVRWTSTPCLQECWDIEGNN